ncbi:carbamoyl-phosphate synthase L chain, ATP binding domain-containing protein [Aspergillus pseudodeflectus]|uniref:Carbamoyl-phosphate synthase L chain, ATP binding domain-containing protein n=1 Tax=Aspergillus pseudodeflectus TaxID=176178 RepID=A0ABR4JRK6_9EURO
MPSTSFLSSAAPERPTLYVAPPPLRQDGRPVIRKVLIANRGEIACRVIQTCRKLGIASVAVFVDEDSPSLHIQQADEAVNIGSIDTSAINPFLNVDLLVQTAVSVGADAVHPGYGYLSENATFADRVRDAGLIFIGPGTKAMLTLGDKRAAKDFLLEHAPDVPLIPGYRGSSQDPEELRKAAAKIGFPVMLKASAGGGGKGMRIIREEEAAELDKELLRAQSEAQRNFGSADIILEKYIQSSKHVEIQIMGDSHGTVLSFFERDCSVQRRHQKVIEETPCTFLTPETRKAMSDTALTVARLIGYENAGTVEFVVDAVTGKFYFLEVNARLQVEHPITEEVTGVDLVALQLFVAAGGRLDSIPELKDLRQTGHAIECRLCAEDPRRNFFPEQGKIYLWLPTAEDRDIRYETAVRTGSSVSIYFDSMIAKIVVWAPTRALAVEKMAATLSRTVCAGVRTNQLLLQRCLLHGAFGDPAYTTSFLPTNLDHLLDRPATPGLPELPKILPVLSSFVRRGLDSQSSSARRPFQDVRPQFRNQRFDRANGHYDIVTVADWPFKASEHWPRTNICSWNAQAKVGPSASAQQVSVLAVNEDEKPQDKNLSVAKEITFRYNKISQLVRGTGDLEGIQSQYSVSLDSWDAVGPNSYTVRLSINGSAILAHVVATAPAGSQSQTLLVHLSAVGTFVKVKVDTALSFIESTRTAAAASAGEAQRTITAPMPCKVLSVVKQIDSEVKSGETVMVIESMKMEVTITVAVDGKFQTSWKEGDAVEEGKVLCTVT